MFTLVLCCEFAAVYVAPKISARSYIGVRPICSDQTEIDWTAKRSVTYLRVRSTPKVLVDHVSGYDAAYNDVETSRLNG